jgi:hypothetical protein
LRHDVDTGQHTSRQASGVKRAWVHSVARGHLRMCIQPMCMRRHRVIVALTRSISWQFIALASEITQQFFILLQSPLTLSLPRTNLTLGLNLVAVGLVLRLEVEVLVRRSKEHLTAKLLANPFITINKMKMLPTYLILIQSL